MLHLVLKPHRESLEAATPDVQKLFVLLKVIPVPRLAQVRPPLALAIVLDTSGSMRERANHNTGNRLAGTSATKLDHAVRATQTILNDARLSPDDQITIIQFADVARTLYPLSPLHDGRTAHTALEQLQGYSGGTRMAQGLRAACNELSLNGGRGAAQRVLVLTDGQAFDPDECRESARQLAAINAPLVTIGIGDDYHEELLRDLAEIGRGRPYHLHDIGQLGEVFETEVSTSVREVVTGLQGTVRTVQGVSLDGVTRVYPDLAEMSLDASPVPLGNIAAGDYTVFVLELTVSGMARPVGRARLAQVRLSGSVPGLGETVESSPNDIVVAFTGDEAAVENVDGEVLSYVQQRNADRMVQQALRQAQHDLPGARRTLRTALEITQRVGNVRATRLLQNSLDELDATGTLSPGTRKTMALDTRTRTIKTTAAGALENVPSEDEIRRLTGA